MRRSGKSTLSSILIEFMDFFVNFKSRVWVKSLHASGLFGKWPQEAGVRRESEIKEKESQGKKWIIKSAMMIPLESLVSIQNYSLEVWKEAIHWLLFPYYWGWPMGIYCFSTIPCLPTVFCRYPLLWKGIGSNS